MEQLYIEYKKVTEEIKLLSKKIGEAYNDKELRKDSELYKDKLRKLFDEMRVLSIKRDSICVKMSFLIPPIKTNNIIDLRCTVPNSHCYSIYIHDTNQKVGEIDYRGYHVNDYVGDISYQISEEFRGNNYAYQALTLLSEKLYEEGILDFWVGVNKRNIPSLKVIEKNGGVVIKDNSDVLLFQCTTQKNKKYSDSTVTK